MILESTYFFQKKREKRIRKRRRISHCKQRYHSCKPAREKNVTWSADLLHRRITPEEEVENRLIIIIIIIMRTERTAAVVVETIIITILTREKLWTFSEGTSGRPERF
jgi:hypothetical protein